MRLIKSKEGFTLIELVVVIIVLGILAVIAVPKFIDFRSDADTSVLKGMQGSLKSTRDLVAAQIALRPESLNNAQSRFTLEDGQSIRVRAHYPDGRWNSTFAHLVDFDSVTFVTSNQCTDSNSDTAWCARNRGLGWFTQGGYTTSTVGRGFVIFPRGNNLNNDRCYLYYFTPNDSNVTKMGVLPSVELDLTDCG
ncbi:type II secretion system protein [uncultured Shewanella sp.]|uniref:type II secretion system protein n=1 Tax=uncultured Shewanella sp. TaxID=173975 RepID=UPI00262907F4|nr:type II secretion system protein [uncultured Shewanella sp.]